MPTGLTSERGLRLNRALFDGDGRAVLDLLAEMVEQHQLSLPEGALDRFIERVQAMLAAAGEEP